MNEAENKLPIGLKVALALVGLGVFLVAASGFGLTITITYAAIAGPINGWWFLLVAAIVLVFFGWQFWSMTADSEDSRSDPIAILYFLGLVMSLGPCGLMFATSSATGPMPPHFELMVDAYGFGWGAFAITVFLAGVVFYVTQRLER